MRPANGLEEVVGAFEAGVVLMDCRWLNSLELFALLTKTAGLQLSVT